MIKKISGRGKVKLVVGKGTKAKKTELTDKEHYKNEMVYEAVRTLRQARRCDQIAYRIGLVNNTGNKKPDQKHCDLYIRENTLAIAKVKSYTVKYPISACENTGQVLAQATPPEGGVDEISACDKEEGETGHTSACENTGQVLVQATPPEGGVDAISACEKGGNSQGKLEATAKFRAWEDAFKQKLDDTGKAAKQIGYYNVFKRAAENTMTKLQT